MLADTLDGLMIKIQVKSKGNKPWSFMNLVRGLGRVAPYDMSNAVVRVLRNVASLTGTGSPWPPDL